MYFTEILVQPFFIKSLLCAIALACSAAILGCFVVWKKIAYFGDSLSHSSIFPVAIAIILGISSNLSLIFFAALYSLLLTSLSRFKLIDQTSYIYIVSTSFLSLGLVLAGVVGVKIDLHSLFFGDLLLIGVEELLLFLSFGIIIVLWYLFRRKHLLRMTVSEDLAFLISPKVVNVEMELFFLLAIFVVLALKFVGILLVSSVLVFPAAAARFLSRTPNMMMIISFLIANIAMILGLFSAIFINVAPGPLIALSLGLIFLFSFILAKTTFKTL